MVMGGTPVLLVVGSNPSTVQYMDIFHIICCKLCNACSKKIKNK